MKRLWSAILAAALGGALARTAAADRDENALLLSTGANLGLSMHDVASSGFVLGGEASLVLLHLDNDESEHEHDAPGVPMIGTPSWLGLYGDILRDTGSDTTRFSIGPEIAGWTDPCGPGPECTFTAVSDVAIQVRFEPDRYQVAWARVLSSTNCIGVESLTAGRELVMTGLFRGETDIDSHKLVGAGANDILLAGFDSSSGRARWARLVGARDNDNHDLVGIAPSGDLVLQVSGTDPKYGGVGHSMRWIDPRTATVNQAYSTTDWLHHARLLPDGDVIGLPVNLRSWRGPASVARLDGKGAVRWTATLGATQTIFVRTMLVDWPEALDEDGNIVFALGAGSTVFLGRELASADPAQIWIVSASSALDHINWVQRFREPALVGHVRLHPGRGSLFVSGIAHGWMEIGSRTLGRGSSEGSMVVAELAPDGRVRWAGGAETGGDYRAPTLARDQAGNVFLSGKLERDTFIGGHPVAPDGPRGCGSIYLAKLVPAGRENRARPTR